MGIVSTARLIREQSGSKSTGLTPGAKVVDAAAVGLEGVEGESIGSKGSTAHCGPEIPLSALAPKFPHPTQPPTVEDDSSLNNTHVLSTQPWHSLVSASGLHP